MRELLEALHADEDGAGATEYIVLLILIACVIIAIVTRFGAAVSSKFEEAEGQVNRLSPGSAGGA